MPIKTLELFDDDDEEYCADAPARWEICSRCEGEGSHTNPSIDDNGITQSEWAEWDFEEREAYFAGAYDVRCSECKGEGKVLEVDAEAFRRRSPMDFSRWISQSRIDKQQQVIEDSEARWERRMLYGSD